MDPMTMALMGGGSILSGIGGLLGSGAQGRASQASGQMGLLGAILAGQAAEQGYQRASQALSPYTTAGSKAMNLLSTYLQGDAAKQAGIGGGGANLLSTFQPTQQQLESTPGYQFALSQGLKQVQNAAAGKGMGTGGQAMQQGTDYATGLASTTFQQQLQNYMAQNQQAFNMLFQPSQLGGQAASNLAGAATNASQLIANAAMGGGQALGAGIMGQGNATAQGYNALFGGMGNAATIGGYYGGGYNKPYSTPTSQGWQASPAFAPVTTYFNKALGGMTGQAEWPQNYQ